MVQKAGGGQDSGFMVRMGVISKPTLGPRLGRSEVSLAGIWRSGFQKESQANTQALDRSGPAFTENIREARGWHGAQSSGR